MRRNLTLTASLALVAVLGFAVTRVVAQQGSAPATQPAGAGGMDSTLSLDDGFDSETDRRSYAIGLNIAQSLSEGDIDVNTDLVIEAMRTKLSGGEARLTEEQTVAVLTRFQQEMQMKAMQQQMEQQGQMASQNAEEGRRFMEENKQKEGVQTTESGLQYVITEMGDGPKPGPRDMVKLHYTGRLINGEVFDSSEGGEPVSFPIDRVIPGFGEGLQMLPVGTKAKLFIPGDQAYGQSPQGPGGPNVDAHLRRRGARHHPARRRQRRRDPADGVTRDGQPSLPLKPTHRGAWAFSCAAIPCPSCASSPSPVG